MTQKTTAQPSAAEMLREAQNYRTSLEALMSVGRGLLLSPSMENDAAASFKVLTENVLEEANHQADLQVVDGVEEPAAQVELIMQDVLTPRLTEVEQIEQALAIKAENDEPVPFTTRDAETSASMESLAQSEILGLFHENIKTVGTMLSMESATADMVRPQVLAIAKRAGEGLAALGISMEDLEQTQVIGEMQDAVARIETLVEKARESADEIAENARAAAAEVGSEGGDPLGDLIEQHRADRPTGANLDDGTTTSTVDTAIPGKDASGDAGLDEGGAVGDPGDGSGDLQEPDAGGDDLGAGGDDLTGGDAGDDLGAGADGDGTDLDLEGGDGSDLNDAGAGDGTDGLGDGSGDDLGDGTDGGDAGTGDDLDGGDVNSGDADGSPVNDPDNVADENDNNEEEEEEDEDDLTNSNESDVAPVVFEDFNRRAPEEVLTAKPILGELMNWLSGYDLLTEKGQAQLAAGVEDGFVLDSSMVTTGAAEVLARHYDTWINGSIRDGSANIMALAVLMGV